MEEFKKYFTGLTRDFGFCNVENGYIDENSGKLKIDPGDYGWAHRAISDEDYQKHLDGKVSIGLQPCDDEGTCSFGAIDVDPKDYSASDLRFLLEKAAQDPIAEELAGYFVGAGNVDAYMSAIGIVSESKKYSLKYHML